MSSLLPAVQATAARVRAPRGRDAREVCLVCAAALRRVTNTHLRLHGLTVVTYRQRYLGIVPRRRTPRPARCLRAGETIRQALGRIATELEARRRAPQAGL